MKPSRFLLINILATAVFYIGSFAALGSSFPTVDSSGQDIVAWFTANGTNARIYAWALRLTARSRRHPRNRSDVSRRSLA